MSSQAEEESDGEHETILDLVKRPKLFIRKCVALSERFCYEIFLIYFYFSLITNAADFLERYLAVCWFRFTHKIVQRCMCVWTST